MSDEGFIGIFTQALGVPNNVAGEILIVTLGAVAFTVILYTILVTGLKMAGIVK